MIADKKQPSKLPFAFNLFGHLERTRVLELLAEKLNKDLEAIAANPDIRIAGVHRLDRQNALGVDFLTYVAAAVGGGNTETEQAFVIEFREEFRKYVWRRASHINMDHGIDATGRPGILDANTYGIRYKS